MINISDIHGEIGDVLLGNIKCRTSEEEITIFDITGMGVKDNVTAELIYKKALETSIGLGFGFLDC